MLYISIAKKAETVIREPSCYLALKSVEMLYFCNRLVIFFRILVLIVTAIRPRLQRKFAVRTT